MGSGTDEEERNNKKKVKIKMILHVGLKPWDQFQISGYLYISNPKDISEYFEVH